jgi:hypothetical protein
MAMLALLLFNLGGYSLLFQYLISRSDSYIINEKINKNRYVSSDLVEVKIPVHINTIQDWTEYEPISGQVQLSNACYNYAQLKLTRDTMYLMVIPNYLKTHLIKANIIYAKQVSDTPLSKKSHLPFIKKSIAETEYNYSVIRYNADIPANSIKTLPDYTFLNILKTSIGIPGQPPEGPGILS